MLIFGQNSFEDQDNFLREMLPKQYLAIYQPKSEKQRNKN